MLTAIKKNKNSALTEIAKRLFSVLAHQKEALKELRAQVWMQRKQSAARPTSSIMIA